MAQERGGVIDCVMHAGDIIELNPGIFQSVILFVCRELVLRYTSFLTLAPEHFARIRTKGYF